MKNEPVLLCFRGTLWENRTFQRRTGWETETVFHRAPEGDGTYWVRLVGEDGESVLSVSPKVEWGLSCCGVQHGARTARVKTYVPLHPAARRLEFGHKQQLIYAEEIAAQPPSVKIVRVALDGDRLELEWSAGSGLDGLRFSVAYLADRRPFLLARELRETRLEADLGGFPGCVEGRVAVLASDGVRSASTVSEPFTVPRRAARVAIARPNPLEVYPPDQPLTLSGTAVDLGGAALSENNLVWSLDGKVVSRGRRLACAVGLEPGEREVTLEYLPPDDRGELRGTASVRVMIARPAESQERQAGLLGAWSEYRANALRGRVADVQGPDGTRGEDCAV